MGLVAFTACETDPTDLLSKDAVAPVMDEHAAILMTPNTPDETVTFTWKAARNLEGTVNYYLYAELNGEETVLAKTEATFYTANKSALRQQLLAGFNLEGNENFDLNLYVVADNGVQALKSATQMVKVYVYGDYKAAVVTISESIPAEGLVLTDKEPEEQTLLVWEPARFENAQTVTYRVELETGNGFRVQLATGLDKTEYKTTWPKLNSLLLKNGFEKDRQYELSFLVTAMSESTPDYDGVWLESEPVKLKVTTYTPAFPDFLYVIGDFCGHDGLNTLEKAPILKGDANEGVYHGVVTIYGGKFEFYYINPRTVNDPEPKKIFVGGTTENTGSPYYWKTSLNAEEDDFAPQDGTYAFYVNLNDEYARAFKINSVGLIGEKGLINGIADDWGKEAQFTFNETTFCYELDAKFSKSEGQYKVRLNNNWNKPFPELNDGNDVSDPGYNFGQEIGVQHDPTKLVTLAWDQMGENIVSAAGEYKVVIDFSTNANYSMQFTQTGVVNEYGLSGDYNQWGADGKDKKFGADPDQEGWYVVKDFVVTEGQQMIIRLNDSDAQQWGMATAGQTAEADKTYTLKADGEKFALAAGTYDVFFNPETLEFYATQAGAYYGLCGEHNSWGATADPQFVKAADKDGWLVLKGFSATAGKQAKIRKNDSWADNWGLPGAEIAVGEQYTLEYNVDNFKWAATGVYDIYFNPSTLELYIEEGAAIIYALVGDLNGWNPADETFAMADNGNGYKVIKGVEMQAGSFKIIEVGSWDNPDYGMPEGATLVLGQPVTLALDGAGGNISMGSGTYDIYFNPSTLVLYIVEAGADDPTVAPTPSEPEYSLYGAFNYAVDWGDTDMEKAENGYYKALGVVVGGDNFEFLIRTNHAWDEKFGKGAVIEIGVATTLEVGGDNMKIAAAGTYDFYFNPTKKELYIMTAGADDPTATPSTTAYSLVGSMNGWNAADKTYTFQTNGGKLELKGVTFATDGTFKVVENYSWDNADYGGTLTDGVVNLEAEVQVNIAITAGIYDMELDIAALKLYVTKVGDVTPVADSYVLAGTHNGWKGDDANCQFTDGGKGVWSLKNITFGPDGKFKVVKNGGIWCGGVLANGEVMLQVDSGDDIAIDAGSYDFYLTVETMKLQVVATGSPDPNEKPAEPEVNAIYGLVGQHNSWGGSADTPFAEYADKAGYFKATQALAANDPFKIRSFGKWDDTVNFGVEGAENSTNAVAVGTSFAVVNGAHSRNMCVTTSGTYDIYFNPTELKCLIVAEGTTPNFGGTTPDQPGTTAIYGLVGQHNSWGGSSDTPFVEYADKAGYFKATQALVANDPFKIRSFGKWDDTVNFGVEGAENSTNAVAVGTSFAVVNGAHSRNMCVTTSGTYDIYFNPTALKCLIVAEGTTPDFNANQTPIYGLVGDHNDWGSNGDDTPFVECQKGYFKATQALKANKGFKVRGYNDSSWNLADLNFGYPGANTVIPVGEIFTVEQGKGSKDMMVATDGTYDLYLNPSTKKFLVVTEGTTPSI